MDVEIDGTRQMKEQDKRIENEVAKIQLCVVIHLERNHLLTMSQEVGKGGCQHSDAAIEPIGHHHSQQGCDAASQGEGAEVTLNAPIDRDEPQQLGKDQRCHRHQEISDKGQQRVGLLIGGEQREEGNQREQHQHTSWLEAVTHDRKSQQQDKHAAQHARVHPQQHVGIVQLGHQVHRQGGTNGSNAQCPVALLKEGRHMSPQSVIRELGVGSW